MKPNLFFISIFATFLFSCANTSKTSSKVIRPSPIDLNEWEVESTPNNLDQAGTLFAMTENGKRIRIPGGDLKVLTNKSPTILTEQKFTRSIEGALEFLQVSVDNDSFIKVGFKRSSQVVINFSVKDGILTNINDDLGEAFEKRKIIVQNNLSRLEFDTSKVYIILETIQSSKVSMTFDKTTSTNANTSLLVKLFSQLGGKFQGDIHRQNSLIYEGNEALVVFYKLYKMKVNVSRIKGSNDKKVELSF